MVRTTGVSIVERLRARGLLELVDGIARAHYVARADLLGRRRTKSVAAARRAVCRALRDANLSFTEIGWLLGRDHSSVMFLCRDDAQREAAAFERKVAEASREVGP
jgi:chromosomal replication initiation ATPase DnaA